MVIDNGLECVNVDQLEVEVPVLFPDRVHNSVNVMVNAEVIMTGHCLTDVVTCSQLLN